MVTGERSQEAEQSFNAVIELEVKKPHPPFNGVDLGADSQAHYYLGNIWLERGNLAKARSEYNESFQDLGDNARAAIYGLGIVSYREGKVDEALIHLNKVIQLSPRQFPNAYLARGGIKAERRQLAEALPDFNVAIEIYKQQAIALEAKAQYDDSKGWKRKAEGERRRKALIEAALEKATESKKAIETLLGGPG